MNIISLTGDRPTGKLHLGHYVGSLVNRTKMQDTCTQYIMIANIQGLSDYYHNPNMLHDNVYELMRDYLAVGLDPNKNIIFLQSEISAISELTIYFLNLVTIGRLERNPTVKAEIQQKNMHDSLSAGFLCYPISQVADILSVNTDLVPVGDDQIPMIEQTNEIVRKFNRIYNCNIFKEVKAILSHTPRLIGIDGKAKAGKSLNNAIFLDDDEHVIKEKVFSMYTDPNHINIYDCGKVEGNVVFDYLDAFYDDKNHLDHLKQHYKKGGLGDVTLKNLLNNVLQNLIAPIRKKRRNYSQEYLSEILQTHTKKVQSITNFTLKKVKQVMKLSLY